MTAAPPGRGRRTSRRATTAAGLCLLATAFAADDPRCVQPGPLLIADPPGDQTGSQLGQNTQADITAIRVSERRLLSGTRIVVTMKVNNLATLPSGSNRWIVTFTGGGLVHALSMTKFSDSNAVEFHYNRGNTNPSCFTNGTASDALLDGASTYDADGTITLVVKDSTLGVTGSDALTLFNGKVQTLSGSSVLCNPSGATLDSTGNATYDLTPVGTCPVQTAPGDVCVVPGMQVMSEPGGDQTGGPSANAQLDVRSLGIAQPAQDDGARRLYFTLKVDNLASVPANGQWTVYMNTPYDSAPSNLMKFVAMTSDANSAVSFVRGHVEDLQGNNNLVNDGALEPGSGYNADGTITLVLNGASFGLATGDALTGLLAQTQQLAGTPETGGLLVTVDEGNSAYDYSVLKADICANLEPIVDSFGATPVSGNTPLSVDFTATAHDPDDAVASYTFDFGDGTAPVTQATPTISHVYASVGAFTAGVTAKDTFGKASATATVAIDVVNRAPTAALSAAPVSGNSPLSVSFDAGTSSDPDGGDSIVSYTFDFGDGTAAVTQPGTTIDHTYTDDGNYTATLTVTDSHGLASTPVTVPIVVSSGPPVARLSITPSAPAKGDGVTLDGSLSSVTDVVEYTFDPGDGSGAVTVLPPATATSHIYRLSGTYTVSLSVKDANDAVSTTTATINVSNTAPVADLTASPDPAQGQPPLTVSFDASGSSDPDAAKLPGEDFVESYEFDYGDGVIETVTVPAVNHVYTTPGTYEARLTVYDREGKKSSNQAAWPNIVVLDSPPVAVLGADQTSGGAPLTVVLDGAGSSDPDAGDGILSYTFDFGDGSEPVVRYGASDVQHTYAAPGAYDATLVVRDNSNVASAPATVAISVGPVNRAPIARASASTLSGPAPLTVAFDASASSDTDGDAIVQYIFDFGDGSAPVTQAGSSATHTYTAAGRHAGSVTVRDARGALSSNSDAVTIVVNDTLGENTAAPGIEDSKGPFSGALSPWSLLALGLLTVMRRRRAASRE